MMLMSRDVPLIPYRLTTADIVYYLPDHPSLLQNFIWQDLDLAPEFPILHRFLRFWQESLDGKVHSVTVAAASLIEPAQFRYADGMLVIQ